MFDRVISIKNYHPKIRIITQMLQYHNKVNAEILIITHILSWPECQTAPACVSRLIFSTSRAGTGRREMMPSVWLNWSWVSSLRAVWHRVFPLCWPISFRWDPTLRSANVRACAGQRVNVIVNRNIFLFRLKKTRGRSII